MSNVMIRPNADGLRTSSGTTVGLRWRRPDEAADWLHSLRSLCASLSSSMDIPFASFPRALSLEDLVDVLSLLRGFTGWAGTGVWRFLRCWFLICLRLSR